MLQFEFNGHTSDEYGLIVTRIEENDTLVNRSLQLGEKNKYRPKENQFGTLYSDNYSFKMGVMRNPCRNKNVVPELKNGILKYDPTYTPYLDNGILKFSMNYTADIKNGIIIPNDSDYLTSNNIRIINAWLTSPQYPRLLKFIGDDYFSEEIEFFATITEVSTEHASLPYELTYTVTCDSQWGYTPLILCKTTSSSTPTVIGVYGDKGDPGTTDYNGLQNKPVVNGAVTAYQSDIMKSQLRNVTFSTEEPKTTDGKPGDMWVVYGDE